MKALVICVGNMRGRDITMNYIYRFKHNPPTASEIRDAEKEIAERNEVDSLCIINWMPLSEE